MKVIFTWKELIVMEGMKEIARYPASCKVRTELNGQRKKSQVVFTLPASGNPEPYYPRQFRSGIFFITGVEYTDDKEYAPVKIKTTAERDVFTWRLDHNGHYRDPTGKTQIDTCYWLHYTGSNTTLGCIRIGSKNNALLLAGLVEAEIKNDRLIYLEVL